MKHPESRPSAAAHGGSSHLEGVVVGGPRRWLGVEGATLVAAALVGYSTTGQPWWLVPLLILLPDISALGYLAGAKIGARAYNLAHVTPFPAAVVGLGWWQGQSLIMALGLTWLAHIGADRLVGYGLKYGDVFQHTHLSKARIDQVAVPEAGK